VLELLKAEENEKGTQIWNSTTEQYNPNHEECDGRGCSAQIIVIEGI
jgi:hypothetical protein